MNLKEIETKINNIFLEVPYRQIIFWYDESKEFEEDIINIQLDNAELYLLKEDNLMYTKYYVEIEKMDTNFLIYAPFERPSDEENYLADMVHYAVPFTADKISLLAQDLNIPKELHYLLEKYKSFWNANSRIQAFKNLNINYTETNIILGILAVLSNQKMLNFDYILREVIINNSSEDNKIINDFSKFNILDDFWLLVSKKYKYSDTNPTVKKLIISLILNYTADFYEGNYLSNWKPYIVEDRNNAHIFIDEFMNNAHYNDIYDEISLDLEKTLKVDTIRIENIDSYKHCDSFERFDQNIIAHYVDILITNQKDLGNEFKELMEYRKKTHFYPKYEDNYLLLHYANCFISLINDFKREGISDDVEEIIREYADKWAYIDSYYRKFYYHYDRIENRENLDELRQLIENIYLNRFLNKINPIFSKKLVEKGLSNIDLEKQWKFYKRFIPTSVKKHKTAVIISDAFRYGCAVELYSELKKDPKRRSSLNPMVSTIPSITSLGMAALLPHKEIIYDGKNVLVDGKKTISTDDRSNILNVYNPQSIALPADDIRFTSQRDMKKIVDGKNLLYLYHNKIDSIGDKASSENDVFNAAQETIGELIEIINKLSSLNFSGIFITADHGFIYKRDKLEEKDKVDLKEISLEKNKRYLLSDKELDIDGSVSLPMDYLDSDLSVNVPIGVDVFKAPGSGLNYVHGGASLEECIIPLLEVKARKGAKNQSKVGLQLLSTNNRVTNYEVMLTFYQTENISNKVIPLEAAIYFADEDDMKISNEVIIHADKNTDSAEDREFRRKFTLSRVNYSKSKNYYLIIKDNQEDIEIDRTEFMIDIAFQDGFDF